jgi:hypothetical protein
MSLPARAQSPTVSCGDASKDVPLVIEEQLRGDVEGKAQLLTKMLGSAQIKGTVDASRTELQEEHKNLDQHQIDMYYLWVSCQVIIADKNLSTPDKVKLWADVRLSFPSATEKASGGWGMSPNQADALRIRLTAIFPKLPVFIKCRTTAADCEKLAYLLYDVLQKAGWSVAPPMTTQGGNLSMTGERGIRVISTSFSAQQMKNALQARDGGDLPVELDTHGDDQHILINIGDRT